MMREMEANFIEWAKTRGIYEHSTAQAQFLKGVSEMGELADALIKGEHDKIRDGVGDVIVCLTHVAFMKGLTLEECMTAAWNDIKDRKGRMNANGAWVKEPVQMELDFRAPAAKPAPSAEKFAAVKALEQALRNSGNKTGITHAKILQAFRVLKGTVTLDRLRASMAQPGVPQVKRATLYAQLRRMMELGYLEPHQRIHGAYQLTEDFRDAD
jgi:NTP pyrophosphatase (non-canonical NTP hydrolase)